MNTAGQQTRTRVSLDSEWEFCIDPENNGKNRDLHSPSTIWPCDITETVSVPHIWQENEKHRSYTGAAWYRTTLEYDGRGERSFLRFGAVDYESTVYVNGTEVGNHEGGYLPFEIEVTDAINTGSNSIVVQVTDPENIEEIPHGKQGNPWYTRVSGIWQSVVFETRPSTFVSSIEATPDLSDDTVTISIKTDGVLSDKATIIVSKNGTDIISETSVIMNTEAECTLSILDPCYWTPDTPELYDIRVKLKDSSNSIDIYSDYFGMRSFESKNGQFYLNGDPYYIRGALDQGYYPNTLYRPFSDSLFEEEIRIAKKLGFNMLRKHLKPAHPDFIEAADRMGILVWEEPANPTIYTDQSKQRLRKQLRELISRDYNRPSVVMWSIYNEEWGIGLDQQDYSNHSGRLWNDREKQDYLRDLFHKAKKWDPTRLLCDNSGWSHVETDVNDYHEYFVSPERLNAWEKKLDEITERPDDNYAVERTSVDRPPIVISELGTWGFPDLEKIRSQYGGDPPWFSHEFDQAPLKRPASVDDRYEATNLSDIFDNYAHLKTAWQRREADSLKGIIESLRTDDAIAGYIVTEFSDIEWEFNGILDYFRDPKETVVERIDGLNQALLVVIEPLQHVCKPGGSIYANIHIVNDTAESVDGTVHWAALDKHGTQRLSVGSFGTTTLDDKIKIDIPVEMSTTHERITATFETDTQSTSNEVPIIIVEAESASKDVVYTTGPISESLTETEVTVTDDLTDADIAIVHSIDEEILQYIENGNSALVVPDESGRMRDEFGKYRNLPTGESWNLATSLLYQDSPLINDLCVDSRIGWGFEELFPYDLVNDVDQENEVHVGLVEGWLANWGSPLIVSEHGEGTICQCTFRVTANYGTHPTATTLINRLIRYLS